MNDFTGNCKLRGGEMRSACGGRRLTGAHSRECLSRTQDGAPGIRAFPAKRRRSSGMEGYEGPEADVSRYRIHARRAAPRLARREKRGRFLRPPEVEPLQGELLGSSPGLECPIRKGLPKGGYKPDSVPPTRARRLAFIHLADRSPLPAQGGARHTRDLRAGHPVPYFVLHRIGFFVPPGLPPRAVVSYTTFSPLPRPFRAAAVCFL